MTMRATAPPIRMGQLVTIRSQGEELPGTVIELASIGGSRWEIWVEVLASVGVGTSRHIVDGGGLEVGSRPGNLVLVSPGAW